MRHLHEAMPAIGTEVEVLRHGASGDVFQTAVVVGHHDDPALGSVIELELGNARRLQRTWPTSTIRRLSA
jgi:hypothetical protein